MKITKDPLFITIIFTGIAIGAGAMLAGDKYPAASLGILAAWVVAAAIAAVILTKRRRHG
ncbi:hypothetical protein ARTHRO9V_130181 [Arthrobacter sp. 9V]|uniref:hypothetical protein n=1 Tax=Arthrobacter sp. 9V TaxID=2653132 RepID=UPI0012F1D117|nr:hypothetical protein [Arthrobacter sp. 9V]VXB24251.1 hypothetical protein ARTHRO9V_130181 [Arthrobacter sp. 9V]